MMELQQAVLSVIYLHLIELCAVFYLIVTVFIHWQWFLLLVYVLCIPVVYGFVYRMLEYRYGSAANKTSAFMCGLFWPVTMPLLLLVVAFDRLSEFGERLHK